MGEIKSTLDLIMEKTRHLSLKEEEKDSMKRDALVKRVQGLVFGFLNEGKKATVLAREFNELPPEQHEEARDMSLALFTERASPFEDNTRILAGVETLRDAAAREAWEEAIDGMKLSFEEQEKELRGGAGDRAREDLAAIGLSGPALLPNAEAARFLQEEREKLATEFRNRLRKKLGLSSHR